MSRDVAAVTADARMKARGASRRIEPALLIRVPDLACTPDDRRVRVIHLRSGPRPASRRAGDGGSRTGRPRAIGRRRLRREVRVAVGLLATAMLGIPGIWGFSLAMGGLPAGATTTAADDDRNAPPPPIVSISKLEPVDGTRHWSDLDAPVACPAGYLLPTLPEDATEASQ